jgi:hypothetical protein
LVVILAVILLPVPVPEATEAFGATLGVAANAVPVAEAEPALTETAPAAETDAPDPVPTLLFVVIFAVISLLVPVPEA